MTEGGINSSVSEVRGGIGGSRGRHRKGKGKERAAVLETVVEVPEEEEEKEEEVVVERKRRRDGAVGRRGVREYRVG